MVEEVEALVFQKHSLTKDEIETVIQTLRRQCSTLRFPAPIEITSEIIIDYKNNWPTYGKDWKLLIDDEVKISLKNLETQIYEDYMPPYEFRHVLQIQFLPKHYREFRDLLHSKPTIRGNLVSFLCIICEQLDTFLMIASTDECFILDSDPQRELYNEAQYLRDIFRADDVFWNTFYFDIELFNSIGADVLCNWAESVIPIGDHGYFIQTYDLPFVGRPDINNKMEKKRTFNKNIVEHIIERVQQELP